MVYQPYGFNVDQHDPDYPHQNEQPMAPESTLSLSAIVLWFIGPMVLAVVGMILLSWRSNRKRKPERKREQGPHPSGAHHDAAEYEARSKAGMG